MTDTTPRSQLLGHRARAAVDEAKPGKLAELRRQALRPLEDAPLIWAWAEVFTGRSDPGNPYPTHTERAMGAMLGMYVLHKQNVRRPHQHGQPFTAALAAANGRPPLVGTITSATFPDLLAQLHIAIRLLASKGEPFDYDRVARDLRAWQQPDRRPGVQGAWAKDYWLASIPTPTTEDPAEAPGTPEPSA